MVAQTPAQKKAAAAKAAKKAALAGGVLPTKEITIDEKYLAAHPELVAQGFTIGQKFEAPITDEDEESEADGESLEREPLDEATMKGEVKMVTENGKSFPIWYVKVVGPGQFRLYNEFGQAVSPVVTDPLQINKAASRANALNRAKLK